MQIRVQGKTRDEIIEAGRDLGIFLKPRQGRGDGVWFGYGYYTPGKAAKPAKAEKSQAWTPHNGYLEWGEK